MWFESLLLASILMIGLVQSYPKNSKLIFHSNRTVQINGTNFNELDCNSPEGSFGNLCTNVTQITCLTRRDLITSKSVLKSCLVTNTDSVFFNSKVNNETITCKDERLVQGNCRIKFSLKSSLTVTKELVLNPDGTITDVNPWKPNPWPNNDRPQNQFDDEFEERRRQMDERWNRTKARHDKIERIVLTAMGIIFALFFLLVITLMCRKAFENCNSNLCSCFKSGPIISEQSRRMNFPASSNASTIVATTQLRTNTQVTSLHNQQSNYSAFNYDSKKAEFTDPPPKYDSSKFDTKYSDPPAYNSIHVSNSAIGNVNQGYVPGSIKPTAPDFK